MAQGKSIGSGSNLAPFLIKCYDMVDTESTDNIISWSESNDSFVIWDMTEFSRDLLPAYFKHRNFSSFMRQLNIYGFRKVDTDRWEFANEGFVKGQKHLLQNIKRRKHPQNTVQKNQQQDQVLCVPDEVDYISLQKEVEILKTDKSALMQELVKLRERHESSQNNLLLLRERLQGMENNQQQLLSFLVMIMQSPGLLSQLFQPKENSWRVAEAGKIVLNDDAVIVRYQPLPDSAPSPSLAPSLDPDKTVDHDVSFDRVKDFLMNFDFPSSPLDESFLSAENYGSIVPTDEFDLDKLEQFLLSSPDRDDTKQDEEETKSALHGIETENCEMNDSPSCFGFNKDSSSLEHLTEKMEGLSPGNVFL
ncbi:heat stress transcription factor A-8 [Amaranthus tricolor]|uniref:heat stress transcription factor A-8 n=1 Tax=Amaranthus tricolor TaxID=29722 RepID=UPI0025895CDB|nr:heat stress transcription factor A-8 [Amaranthus tricolor]